MGTEVSGVNTHTSPESPDGSLLGLYGQLTLPARLNAQLLRSLTRSMLPIDDDVLRGSEWLGPNIVWTLQSGRPVDCDKSDAGIEFGTFKDLPSPLFLSGPETQLPWVKWWLTSINRFQLSRNGRRSEVVPSGNPGAMQPLLLESALLLLRTYCPLVAVEVQLFIKKVLILDNLSSESLVDSRVLGAVAVARERSGSPLQLAASLSAASGRISYKMRCRAGNPMMNPHRLQSLPNVIVATLIGGFEDAVALGRQLSLSTMVEDQDANERAFIVNVLYDLGKLLDCLAQTARWTGWGLELYDELRRIQQTSMVMLDNDSAGGE